MSSGAVSPGGDDLLTVTVVRDEHGYGMKVSGDNPVYVQSVKEHGAAWRAGLRSGDRILRVDAVPVHRHTHQQVVQMIRASPTTVITVQQNSARLKTPITAPVPVNPEKQRQLEVSKAHTVRLMLEQEQKYIRDLRSELSKVPDVRKQAQLESAEHRCCKLQQEIDSIMAGQANNRRSMEKANGFLSGLPRSLSSLTTHSLRQLRARGDARPTTCLDACPARQEGCPARQEGCPARQEGCPARQEGCPPPLPPRAPARRSPPAAPRDAEPLPNSIAMQMSYPLVNVPPPPLQTDHRGSAPVLHSRSRSSPDQLHLEAIRPCEVEKEIAVRDTPPPGTPPPPYATNTQPCVDPQRAIISMEEDDSPASDNSTYSGLFSNLRSVRESKAKTAVLLNWLLAERRCACACVVLILTDAFRSAPRTTLRRWAYEIHSTFLMPNAVLQLNGVDENMANEIDHVLVNEYEKEELLRNVFRKARQKAKEELSQQLSEFQVKRQVGLGTLYGPEDSVIDKCQVDKLQEQVVVERLLCQRLSGMSGNGGGGGAVCGRHAHAHAHAALLAATRAAALALHCRPASVAAAAGGSHASFLQRDKLYKQRLKQLAKQHPHPYVVRGHHLQLQALTAAAHCHHCDHVLWGLAPQAYVCTDCKLRVHRSCAKSVEESCCLDGEHHNNRISRFMERIHNNQPNNLELSDKKSRKASSTTHFLNMERSFRKMEDEQPWEQTLTPATSQERRDESDESLYESADCHSDAISASDDALPRLAKTPTLSKESLKVAVTDEEVDIMRPKKTHRKAMSLSNPLEMVKSLGDEWFESAKRELEKNSDKKKSRESLWSEEDRDSIHGSNMKLDQIRKNSKKEDKSISNSRKSSAGDAPKPRKTSKGSTVSALNFLRRKKTPTSMKPVESVSEDVTDFICTEEIMNHTKLFLEGEKRHSAIIESKPPQETDSDDEQPVTRVTGEHRRRLSRQASRSKSKARGKSQSVKVNTLRKSHSGTLKKGKKKNVKTPSMNRSRQASIVEQTPLMVKKKHSDSMKHSSWFSVSKGEPKREGSTEEQLAPEADVDTSDTTAKETTEKDNSWRAAPSSGRGVNRAESCRERDAPRRGKHRNASDPNRLTAHPSNDLEPGAATAPSGSSSSSSLSSRSNESNTVPADQRASQSECSEDEEPLAEQWADSLPPNVLESLQLPPRLRKRQEVIHELIVSEASHVRWLRVLHEEFLRPLCAQPALLPAADRRALFPNLPDVRAHHARLLAALRAERLRAHVLPLHAVAQALLATLGAAQYAESVSRFCRGQRLALERLRERRRRHKELQAFLAAREQRPSCGRLQLPDLLAVVWQRLTKYRLLLESLEKTVSEAEREEEGAILVGRALHQAKEMLRAVDAAIRNADNEHRIRGIQAKLEVRGGPEWDELRRLELRPAALRQEGELALRLDPHRRAAVLALMFEDMLVLLQREGEKYILKPVQQQHGLLSPVIKWDKVLFRPNAAVRNTFFLMNINGVQMHELSAASAAEYAQWVNCIQEAPLAKVELKQSITPSHHASRSTDDSGINVSRNPSDASEKSNLTSDEPESERDRERPPAAPERDGTTPEQDGNTPERDGNKSDDSAHKQREDSVEKEDKQTSSPLRPIVGTISTHQWAGLQQAPPPAPPAPTHTARTALTPLERLRRLDNGIRAALEAKALIVEDVLGVPRDSRLLLTDMAVADARGQVDVVRQGSPDSDEESPGDITHLLLAAHAQARQLTEVISQAMALSEADVVAARARTARRRGAAQESGEESQQQSELSESEVESRADRAACELERALQLEQSFDTLPELDLQRDLDADLERRLSCAALGAQVSSLSCGVGEAVRAALLAARRLQRDCAHLRAQRAAHLERDDFQRSNEIYLLKPDAEQPIPDQPSNGG